MLIARGEAYEVAAAITIGPKTICEPLKPLIKSVIEGISQKLKDAQQPPF